MNGSIVIFGPAHVGKSTLAGYLHYRSRSDFDLKRFQFETEQELGSAYDASLLFAYIVDKSRDERLGIPRSRSGNLGTSRYVHIERIRIDDQHLNIIDTPGAEHVERERIRGMYLGDVGIFMIEAKRLTSIVSEGGDRLLSLQNLETLTKFFAPLILWRKLKAQKRLVVVLSRMDLIGFDEMGFNSAVDIIQTVLDDDSIDIIPIAINIEDHDDSNVLSLDPRLAWYKGPVLADKLRLLSSGLPDQIEVEPLFVPIEHVFDKPGLGLIWRGKILSGVLRNGALVRLVPVELPNGEYASVEGRVRALRPEKQLEVDTAIKGSILGVDIRDLKIRGRRVQKKDFLTTKTTCLVSGDAPPLCLGQILIFNMPAEEVSRFNLLEDVKVIWFGKVLSSKVVQRTISGTNSVLVVQLLAYQAALPLQAESKETYQYESFLILKAQEFIGAKLVKVGTPNWLYWSLDGLPINLDDLFDLLPEINWEKTDGEIRTNCNNNAIRVIERIRRFADANDLEDVTSRIRIDLKELIESK